MSKSSKHEGHDRPCEHKVKWCKKCDTAYCEYNGCNAEWTIQKACRKQHATFYTTTPNYPDRWDTITSSDRTSGIAIGSQTLTACDHN